ncbi:hypothetical protein ACTMD7_00110 (plasmid) [Enterococcus faecalis]|uniref:hypothetical protein n=1 Tax=Enterococcus faecalis TaxID=1351 RepID=UPI003F91FBB4
MIIEIKVKDGAIAKKSDFADFLKIKLSKKGYERAINGENLIDVVPIVKLKEIVGTLYTRGCDDYLVSEVKDSEGNTIDLVFGYSDILKKLFLFELSKEWELDTAIKRAIAIFKEIEVFEKELNKVIFLFTKEEIEETIVTLFKDQKYYKVKLRLNLFSKYEKLWKGVVVRSDKEPSWNDYLKKNKFADILGGRHDETTLVTREDLLSLFKQSPTPQNAIIPILIFEGVKLAESPTDDEVRRLKISDIKKDKIVIRDHDGGVNREVIIDAQTIELILLAASQTKVYKPFNGTISIVPYLKSPYVLKPIDVKIAYNSDSKEDERAITYRGAYDRMLNIRSLAESLGYERDLTISLVAKSGKINSINKYISSGMDRYDAIRKTLMRFGEWNKTGDYIEEKKLPSNRQLVNRLGKEYKAATGE